MRTIVMTGATSGLGAVAAGRILAAPDTRLLLGARRAGPPGAETLELDLARLDSVRSFAARVRERLGGDDIDALVLNAGRAGRAEHPTLDGFEPTFAINHLAHYLLLRLLEDRLAPRATVVLTTSSTHDPDQKAPIPPPRHAHAWLLAHPDRDPERDQTPRDAHGRAYTSSKLCNLLTARALAASRQAREQQLTVVAYDPGRTPGTGLMRDQGRAINALWKLLGSRLLRPAVPHANSPEAAGGALAELALGATPPPPGRVYASLRTSGLEWPEPSELARRDDVMHALWRDSAELVGLTPARSAAAPAPHGEVVRAQGSRPARSAGDVTEEGEGGKMRVLVAGASGALGSRLVPQLIDAGHDVIGTHNSPASAELLRTLGAEPVMLDLLDARAVRKAVLENEPGAIVHEATALADAKFGRNFDKTFARTNELRTQGTDALLAAAREAGVRRFVAQSNANLRYARDGGPVQTEDDPLDTKPVAGAVESRAAINHLDDAVVAAGGIALRYGFFYGAANDGLLEPVRRRLFPIIGDGAGVSSHIHLHDAAAATVLALEHDGPAIYNIVDDEPAPVREWLPVLANALGAKPPRQIPVWLARLLAGGAAVMMGTEARGASNAKAKRELGWTPRYPSWRTGFPDTYSAIGMADQPKPDAGRRTRQSPG
jgi:2-alkyl-3-oxoalkanoate reductase